MTLHWHGIDVPNAEDGVAGVTQDAVGIGGTHTYRFVADHQGSYWYHSHQSADSQVSGGLFGPLIVHPADHDDHAGVDHGAVGHGADDHNVVDHELVAVAHTYAGVRTINGSPGEQRLPAEPGASARVRVINTDNGPVQVRSTLPYRITAVDGRALHRPTMIIGSTLTLSAGGRADLELTAPADGSAGRVNVGAATSVIIGNGPAGTIGAPDRPVDLLHYGSTAPLPFDSTRPDRRFQYSIGKLPGFYRGRPGLYWSVNGRLYPDVPMYMVSRGDVVLMTIENHSGDVHPMHLHGHHAVVLSRNGIASAGSPWWVDSLNVEHGETYRIAFLADNPGLWMDHCHNLEHAANGMIAHLMYEGVTTPFRVGGPHDNDPE